MTLDTIIAYVRNAIVRFEKEHASSSAAYDRSFGNASLRFQSKGEYKTYAEALAVLKSIDAQLTELRDQSHPSGMTLTAKYLELEIKRRAASDGNEEDKILERLDSIWQCMSDHERGIVDPSWKVSRDH